MKMVCGDARVNGREVLKWYKHPEMYDKPLVAKGIYVNGTLAGTSFYYHLGHRRAELNGDGALTIHSYEHYDTAKYECISEYRWAFSDLTPFG